MMSLPTKEISTPLQCKRMGFAVNFAGFPEGSTWDSIRGVFVEFGTIAKLYCQPESGSGTVYFKESLAATSSIIELNGKPPLNLKLHLKPQQNRDKNENQSTDTRPKRDNWTTDNKTKSNKDQFTHNNRSKTSIGNHSDTNCAADTTDMGQTYLNVFGSEVRVLKHMDGKIYVPMDVLKKMDFTFYEKDKVPPGTTDKIDEKEFQAYIKMKAYEFMLKHKYHPIHEEEAISTVTANLMPYLNSMNEAKKSVPPLRRPHENQENNFDKNKENRFSNDRTDSKDNGRSNFKQRSSDYQTDLEKRKSDFHSHLKRENSHEPQNHRKSFNKPETAKSENARADKWELKVKSPNELQSPNKRQLTNQRQSPNERQSAKEPQSTKGEASNDGKKPQLNIGEVQEVVVSNVKEDGSFSGYLKNNKHLIEQILINLALNRAKVTPIPKPFVGQICQADFLGDMYRAQVRSTSPLKVTYVDYGNENLEDLKEVYALEDSLTLIAPQAINFVWDSNSITEIKEEDEIKIRAVSENRGTYVVQTEKSTSAKKMPMAHITQLIKKRRASESSTEAPTTKSFKSLLDMSIDSAVLEVTESIDENNHIVFAVPNEFIVELDDLSRVEKPSEALKSAAVGDFVSVVYDNEKTIIRGQVVKKQLDTYSVALPDYGIIKTTKEVFALDEKYLESPQFTFVCFTGKAVVKKLADDPNHTCAWVKGAYKVNVTFTSGEKIDIMAKNWKPLDTVATPKVFNKPLMALVLNGNDDVKIVGVGARDLVLRNKASFAVLKDINQEISNFADSAEPLPSKPVQNQIVLCPVESKYVRAVVTKSSDSSAEISLVDLGQTKKDVPLKTLKVVNEKIAAYPKTVVEVRLQSYEKDFSEQAINLLTEFCEKKQIFKLQTTSTASVVSLSLPTGELLADKLKLAEKTGIFFKDMLFTEIRVSEEKEMVVLYEELPVVWLCDPQNKSLTLLGNEIERYLKEKDLLPYTPRDMEVVLAKDDEEWYRATVLKFLPNNACEVQFIDYGNKATVSVDLIRKMPQKLAEIPIFGISCEIKDLRGKPELFQKLSYVIFSGLLTNVKFVGQKSPNFYTVEIPSLRQLMD